MSITCVILGTICQNRAFLRLFWQKIQRYGKMLAAVTRHIAKIRCSPAHKVAQPTQQNTQTFEAAVSFFDADAYVIAACQCVAQQHTTHLFAQPQVKATKVVERFWICSETGPYVVPACHLLTQRAAHKSNSVVKSHAVFFRPYLPTHRQ